MHTTNHKWTSRSFRYHFPILQLPWQSRFIYFRVYFWARIIHWSRSKSKRLSLPCKVSQEWSGENYSKLKGTNVRACCVNNTLTWLSMKTLALWRWPEPRLSIQILFLWKGGSSKILQILKGLSPSCLHVQENQGGSNLRCFLKLHSCFGTQISLIWPLSWLRLFFLFFKVILTAH